MPVNVCWDRLIRFVADDGVVYFGEPILPVSASEVDNFSFDAKSPIKAKVIRGNALSERCNFTGTTLRVAKLLSPLAPESVSAVRCIGGNYNTHRNGPSQI